MPWEGLTAYNPAFDVYREEYHRLDEEVYRPRNAHLAQRRQDFEDARQAYNRTKDAPHQAPKSWELGQGWDPKYPNWREKNALITQASSYADLVRDISGVAADIANSRRDAMRLPGLQWLPGGKEGHDEQIRQWDNIANNERRVARDLMAPFPFLKNQRDQLEHAGAGGFRLVYPGSLRLG